MSFLAPLAGLAGAGAAGTSALSTGLSILGAGVSAIGTLSAANAQAENARYQSQVAANNAVIAQHNATMASQAGHLEAQQQGLKEAEQIGAIKAGIAANNTDVNSGSAVDVQAGQREKANLDQATIEHNAMLQSYGYQTQASNYNAESQLQANEAEQATTAGILGAVGGVIGKASSLKWG